MTFIEIKKIYPIFCKKMDQLKKIYVKIMAFKITFEMVIIRYPSPFRVFKRIAPSSRG